MSYSLQYLKSGVIPGFGHAVLRCTDPRALALLRFASVDPLAHHPDVALARGVVSAVPTALRLHGKSKVKSPYANVDAASGLVLRAVLDVCGSPHYSGKGSGGDGGGDGGSGLGEGELVSLLFAISRAFGILSQVRVCTCLSVSSVCVCVLTLSLSLAY